MAHVSNTPLVDTQGALIGIAGLSRDLTEHNQILEANRLLAEASELLAGTADYDTQLNTLAKLAVPQLADWCAVHVLQADGSIEQVALAHAATAKLQWAREWLQNYLPSDEAMASGGAAQRRAGAGDRSHGGTMGCRCAR